MAKKQKILVQDVLGLVQAICPSALAEEWDNVGLQVGDPMADAGRVMVALDPTELSIRAAIEAQAGVLVVHHPLIFKPMRQVTETDETGRLVGLAIREGVAIVAAHTNLDRARGGLNDWLAEALGLSGAVPLEAPAGDLYKLVVFVPAAHVEAVAQALFAAGAGHVGNYDSCSFRSPGEGSFRGGEGTDPFIGKAGELETVDEIRLETIVPKESLSRAIARMLKAHPYEEVAYDIVALANSRADIGLGRIGRLPEATTLENYSARVRTQLGADAVRYAGNGEKTVEKVAVCGGSGASLLANAVRQGADVLVTGDVKYHEARIAESLGVGIIDAGHFATEHLMVQRLGEAMASLANGRNLDIEFMPLVGEQDPFHHIGNGIKQ